MLQYLIVGTSILSHRTCPIYPPLDALPYAEGIGLIHSIALDPELCETVVSARAIAVALDLCSSSSLTAQAAAVGTLSKLAGHPDTRKRVVRDIVAFGWTSILDLIRSGASRLEAKADGAKVLAICSQHGEGNQASVDAIRADLGSNTLALEYLMDCACDSTTVRVVSVYTNHTRNYFAATLRVCVLTPLTFFFFTLGVEA